MIGRLTCAGLIILMAVLSGVAAVRAENTTSTPAVTPAEIVITDDVQPYIGPLGPDSPLYGLKLALENLDEAFTFNTSEKVAKEMQHAELRIAEIKGLLLMNKSAEAERALDGYFEKMNLTSLDLSSIPARTTGIANAYRQHIKHELVLYDLLQANPNSTELRQAYNHTLSLEGKFMEKSTIQIEKRVRQLNRMTARIVRIDERDQERNTVQGTNPVTTTAPITSETTDHGKGREKQVGKDTGAAPVTTEPAATPSPGDNSGKDKGNGKGKGPK